MAFPVLAAIGGVLDRDEGGLVIGRKKRAAKLGTDRDAKEQLRRRACSTFSVHCPKAVCAAGCLIVVPVGGNPEAAG